MTRGVGLAARGGAPPSIGRLKNGPSGGAGRHPEEPDVSRQVLEVLRAVNGPVPRAEVVARLRRAARVGEGERREEHPELHAPNAFGHDGPPGDGGGCTTPPERGPWLMVMIRGDGIAPAERGSIPVGAVEK